MKKLDKLFPTDEDKLKLSSDIYRLYIEENRRRSDVLAMLNISDAVFADACKRFNIVKPKELSTLLMKERQNEALIARKATMQKRYGVDYAMQSSELSKRFRDNYTNKHGVDNPFKQSHIQKSQRKTMLERYGVQYSMQNTELRNKCKDTFIRNYGVDNPAKNADIMQKARETTYARYGVYYPAQSEAIMQKQIETNLKRYGNKCYLSSIEGRDRIKAILQKRYGVDNFACSLTAKLTKRQNYWGVNTGELTDEATIDLLSSSKLLESYICSLPKNERNYRCICSRLKVGSETVYQSLKKFNLLHLIVNGTKSRAEYEIGEYISSLGLDYMANTRRIIPPFELDIYVPEFRLGIEHNGDYFHSSRFLPNDYHFIKWAVSQDSNICLYHIFEHEWLNHKQAICNELGILLNQVKVINANVCESYDIDDADNLLQIYLTLPVNFSNIRHVKCLSNSHDIVALAAVIEEENEIYMVYCSINCNVCNGLRRLHTELQMHYPDLPIRFSVGKLDYAYSEAGFVLRMIDPTEFYFNTASGEISYGSHPNDDKWLTVYDAGILEYRKEAN